MGRDPYQAMYDKNFPNLAARNHQRTSDPTAEYNCIAWAMSDTKKWWWHEGRGGGWYWPPDVPRDGGVSSYVKLFEKYGYEVCADGTPEKGFEKVAIYSSFDGRVTHAARQKPTGIWTSKLGKGHDIDHITLDALDGPVYGQATKFLKRSIQRESTRKQGKQDPKRAVPKHERQK
jgi:hypothetical protein